jgi:hypothetical protein
LGDCRATPISLAAYARCRHSGGLIESEKRRFMFSYSMIEPSLRGELRLNSGQRYIR